MKNFFRMFLALLLALTVFTVIMLIVVIITVSTVASSKSALTGENAVLVLKHGAAGASFVVDGVSDRRRPEVGPVADVTGAGDALAAGYLVGGPDLAMRAAAACVAHRGAQPQDGAA